MNITVIIFITSFILYKCGAVRVILDKFRLADNEGNEVQATLDKQVLLNRQLENCEETRASLERRARGILELQKKNPDTVNYMGDELLIHLIREYKDFMYSKYERIDLERIAFNVLCARGCKFDTWSYCKGATDNELLDIMIEGY